MSTANPAPPAEYLGPRVRDGIIVQALLALTTGWLLGVATLDGLTAGRLVSPGPRAVGPAPSWLVTGGLILPLGAGALLLIGGIAAARRRVPALVMATTVLATGAWTLTRYVSFDSYYAPNLVRYGDAGIVPWGWPAGVAAVDLAAAALILARRRNGPALAGLMLLVTPVLLLSYGAGH